MTLSGCFTGRAICIICHDLILYYTETMAQRILVYSVYLYYTVCYFTGIFYAVVRHISMLFIDTE